MFPAWFDFHRDGVIRRHTAAQVLYAELLSRPTSFWEPQEIRAWWLADQFEFRRDTVLSAMNLLVGRGYVLEHERGPNSGRRFTVVIARLAASQVGAVAVDGDGSSPERTAFSA